LNKISLFHHELNIQDIFSNYYEWEFTTIHPFDELIISWNAFRPLKGFYLISVSLYTTQWSAWLPYAAWHLDRQNSFDSRDFSLNIHSFQDIVTCQNPEKAGKFKIRIEAKEGASLENFFRLSVCTTLGRLEFDKRIHHKVSFSLPIPPLSQMTLNHPRQGSLCSPTSTTALIHYLTKQTTLSPLSFAQAIYDDQFDIYGNWVLNVAQAFVELGKNWKGWVMKFSSFEQVLSQLFNKIPVIVSIRGPLTGSAQPYQSGHLVVIRGYNAQTHQILCMDPAFLSPKETFVAYEYDEFIQAWKKRGFIGYFFDSSSTNNDNRFVLN
jgi:hypothetical protein